MRLAPWLAILSASASPADLLPHLEQVSRNVWAAGFAAQYGSANCGFVALENESVLIDLPYGISIPDYLAEVQRISGKPAKSVLLTQDRETPGLTRLDNHPAAQLISYGSGRRSIWLPSHGVLFAGPAVVNGPRAAVTQHDTAAWLRMLSTLAERKPPVVVPGFGSWGNFGLIARQRRFLTELRRQVAYGIALGRPLDAITKEFLLPASYYTWMPYDLPNAADIKHVYSELTAPRAPFAQLATDRPNALVLIGDRFHEPEHLEAGLRPALEASGVMPHFTVDVQALTAANLAKADLLVILRDGMNWPGGFDKPYLIWMTPEQEKAVVDFVEGGKAFLNLHNSMGLYPKDGPYLKLVGGNYIGHGPLERFMVEIVDKNHPITRGLSDWWAADEQHTPPYDEKKVHLLMRNRSDDGKAVAAAGWAYEPGKGRLAHLASGHTRDALEHPMYQRALRNAIGWLLRKE